MNELLGSESMSMTASRRNPDVISNYSIGDMVRWHMKMLNGDTAITHNYFDSLYGWMISTVSPWLRSHISIPLPKVSASMV